jgi:DNA (cytosine-5)-methyltransferase 1
MGEMSPAFTFGSLFAGVGGFDLGMERAGGQCLWRVEWDEAAAGVLAFHFPDEPLLADVSLVDGAELPHVDVITYGFPCQDLSVAGKREGFEGKRSSLFYEALRIIDAVRPAVAIAENVPGLFSSDGGRDFARVLGGLGKLGALDIGWSVLDSQHFGVAQRRRRVFIVSDFASRRASEILSLTEGLRGDFTEGGEAGEGAAGASSNGVDKDGANGVAATLNSGGNDGGFRTEPGAHLVCDPVTSKWAKGSGEPAGDECQNLVVAAGAHPGGLNGQEAETQSLDDGSGIRRLTPTECERLQAFPDDWTLRRRHVERDGNSWRVTDRVVEQKDSARYKQLGNAVTVHTAYWLGKQISLALTKQEAIATHG